MSARQVPRSASQSVGVGEKEKKQDFEKRVKRSVQTQGQGTAPR